MLRNDETLSLPSSVEAERSLLGSLLLRSDLWQSAADALTPEDFFLTSHREIFRAMLELGRKYGTFNPQSVATHLDHKLAGVGGNAYLSDLEYGAIERGDIRSLCDTIARKAVLRRIAQAAERLQLAALMPGAMLAECQQLLRDLVATFEVIGSEHPLVACAVNDLLSLELPPRETLLSPILPVQGLVMLFSKRGVGKTYLALGIALAVAKGETFLRWTAPKPRSVLFVDGELPLSTMQGRIRSVAAGVLPDPKYLRIITPDQQLRPMPDITTVEGQALIEREIAGAELLVLDNLSALCRSGKENEGESWLPVQEWLLRLRQRGLSVLLVHHAGKSGAQRGTSRREDLLDTVIALQHPLDYKPSEGLRCDVRYEKARGFYGNDAKAFEVRMHLGGSGESSWSVSEARDETLERAAALYKEGASVRSVAEGLGIPKSNAERLKHKAQNLGMLTSPPVPPSR